MASYVLTIEAQDDIDQIVDSIADEDAAEVFACELHDALGRLGRNPGFGHSRADLTHHAVLFWTFRKRWAVIYQRPLVGAASGVATIIRIVSWALIVPGFWLGADFCSSSA